MQQNTRQSVQQSVQQNHAISWLQQWLKLSLLMQQGDATLRMPELNALAAIAPEQRFIVGLSGAQGSGKTSLARALQQLWQNAGFGTAIVSLDDYYLSVTARQTRSDAWHPLFAERGVPGTHDSTALYQHLAAFRQGKQPLLCRYDKGLDQPAEAVRCSAQTRLLILEGWCVGVEAQPEADLATPVNRMEQQLDAAGQWRTKVNQLLLSEYQPIWALLDQLIWLNAPDWQAVCRWRAWQELPLQQRGQGKTAAELEHFMHYFQRLTVASWQQLPDKADFILQLDQEHSFSLL
jgi:D-glycerate 3-kinase